MRAKIIVTWKNRNAFFDQTSACGSYDITSSLVGMNEGHTVRRNGAAVGQREGDGKVSLRSDLWINHNVFAHE
jgi:hypothetical protein